MPAPSGMHAKLLRELSNRSPYIVLSVGGVPGRIAVALREQSDRALWNGDRDAMPAAYRGAADPLHLLTRPDSSD